MPESGLGQGGATLWWVLFAGVAIATAGFLFFWLKGRRMPGDHVFRASRMSRGNFMFPTQVAVTPTSIVHYTPQLFGGREQSIHMAHIASVLIDRNLFFSDVMIETSGGAGAVRCHGHRKGDAVEMKRLIEQFQSAYYQDRPARRSLGEGGGPERRDGRS